MLSQLSKLGSTKCRKRLNEPFGQRQRAKTISKDKQPLVMNITNDGGFAWRINSTKQLAMLNNLAMTTAIASG